MPLHIALPMLIYSILYQIETRSILFLDLFFACSSFCPHVESRILKFNVPASLTTKSSRPFLSSYSSNILRSEDDAVTSGATTLEMVRAHDPCRTPTGEKGAEDRAGLGGISTQTSSKRHLAIFLSPYPPSFLRRQQRRTNRSQLCSLSRLRDGDSERSGMLSLAHLASQELKSERREGKKLF